MCGKYEEDEEELKKQLEQVERRLQQLQQQQQQLVQQKIAINAKLEYIEERKQKDYEEGRDEPDNDQIPDEINDIEDIPDDVKEKL